MRLRLSSSPSGRSGATLSRRPACISTQIDAASRKRNLMNSVGLIGYGGIPQDVIAALREAGSGTKIVGVLCRPGRATTARAALGDIAVVESLADLLALRPDIVAEVAGQQAVAEYGPDVLRRGFDLLMISVGALADPALFGRLKTAAREGNSRMLLPAGAIGGIDAIAAMRIGGLTSVRYRSRKPPAAWRGSPAGKGAGLHKITGRPGLF